MKLEDIKELVIILGSILGFIVVYVILLAALFGIPAAAIVWIIETIKG